MKKLLFMDRLLDNEKVSTIKDDANNTQYHVDEAKSLPTTKSYVVTNENNNRVGKVEKVRNNFGLYNLPRFHVKTEKENIEILKEMKEFKEEYEILGEEIAIQGDWLSKDFEIHKMDKPIAAVCSHVSNSEEGYEVEVLDESYESLIVCFMVAIIWIHNDEK